MFGRHKDLLVAATYAIVLLVLGVSARLAFVYYRDAAAAPLATETDAATRNVVSVGADKKVIHYDYTAVADANERLAELQSNLNRISNQLQEKSKLLNQRNAECRALEAKLDESVAFAMELLVQESSADRSEKHREAKETLETDFETLRKQLRESQLLSNEYGERVDALRLELMQADLEIASLRERAENEVATLIGERLAIEVAAADALVQLGEEAVPPLLVLLQGPQAEVRLWAATVLGKLGLNATAAIEPLHNLANDPDRRVVEAARRALLQIEP